MGYKAILNIKLRLITYFKIFIITLFKNTEKSLRKANLVKK